MTLQTRANQILSAWLLLFNAILLLVTPAIAFKVMPLFVVYSLFAFLPLRFLVYLLSTVGIIAASIFILKGINVSSLLLLGIQVISLGLLLVASLVIYLTFFKDTENSPGQNSNKEAQ